jgi:hypothetical protein
VAILPWPLGHHTKEHNVTTMEIELIDAALNAPTGLDGLAADMADLAGPESTKSRYPHPNNTAARHAARYWRRLRDARVIIERVNPLAGKWEQVGRLCVASRAHRRTARRIGSSPASAHNH